jgi:hypothetical protein
LEGRPQIPKKKRLRFSNDLKDQDIPAGIFEARRVRWTFHQEFAGQPIRIEVPSFDPPHYTRANWWTDDEGIVSFQNQNIKFVYYRLKY